MKFTKTLTWLALGDSYTIGEGVPLFESYPYQTCQLLRNAGYRIAAPEIIAKTGWTTSNLISKLNETILEDTYDFVTILIGVNNQYQGLSSDEYEEEFSALLKRAVALAGNDFRRTMALSIPDWGQTPFAAGRDLPAITAGINWFNSIARNVSRMHNISFIEISSGSGSHSGDSSQFCADGLHPSGKLYGAWAKLLRDNIISRL